MTDSRWTDMVGAYVLEALDDAERAAFEAQLADDAELRRLVDEAREWTLVLAEALPDLEPPAHLRNTVLERMRQAKASPSPAAPSKEGGADAGAGGRPDIGPGGRIGGSGGTGTIRSTAPWLLLAASVAGLFWLGNENRELERQTATLTDQLEAVRSSLGNAQLALARFDSMAAALSGPNVQLATLTGDADPSLRLVWNRERDLLLVAAQNLPPLPEGRTYQLWGIRGSEAPVSLGTFDTGASGDALVTLPADLTEDYDVSAVTEEPDGGSLQPTTTPFLVGAWTAAQG